MGILYQREYSDMSPFFQTLSAAGIRGLVYNGDNDMACNFVGNQWFVEALGYQVRYSLVDALGYQLRYSPVEALGYQLRYSFVEAL